MGRRPNQSTRNGGRSNNSHQKTSNDNRNDNRSSSSKSRTKTYEDMTFEIGGYGKATDVNKLFQLIINKIKIELKHGGRIAAALENESYVGLTPLEPVMKMSVMSAPAVINDEDGSVTTPAVHTSSDQDREDYRSDRARCYEH